jgi:hypothetical protein
MMSQTLEALMTALLARGADEPPMPMRLTPELAQDILDHDPVNREIRPGNLTRIKRAIEGGRWDLKKAPLMKFLPSGRMSDGQHRVKAVAETGITIPVYVVIVTDTLGVDEGANRTLVDHLQIHHHLPKLEAHLASTVTKALYHDACPGVREYAEFFEAHKVFILECAAKALEWLGEHGQTINAIFKAPVVATLRARAIRDNREPAEAVDQFLHDSINNGKTAPENSLRRQLAETFYKAMDDAHAGRKFKTKAAIDWLLNALAAARENKIRNIITAKRPKKKGRRPPVSVAV